MDLGTVLSVAQTLFSALQCSELKEVLSIFGYKSQLDDLQRTVKTINAVLHDAEAKQELSHQDQIWIEELKDAVFEADDLFDEFLTLAEQKQLLKAGGSLSKKVSNFFSPATNSLSLAYRMSRGVKDMRKKLKAIADNSQFSFKIDPEPIRKRSRETCSYVNEAEIIGREHDLEDIVGKLLASNDQRDMSVLSIVGIGGLGKTALAQLVYNDPRVTKAFPLKMWTCVSDQDQKELDLKNILRKILSGNKEDHTMEQVQIQLRAQLEGKRYLLVLDDVWTENRDQWCKLAEYLVGGERGSWVVVTTRSKKTATINGGQIHELSGLSKENSWRLFERTAFAPNQPYPLHELVEIGEKIVDGCAQVPLAIRVAGTLLYGQEKTKWQFVQKFGLVNVRDNDNGIMPILKLSFHHLESPLKNCFRYCALFPKDHEIQKDMLISLWRAQGYIVPLDNFQSIEDAGEEYFAILLKRCFFQDIKINKFGEIKSCKMHDLMHDIAQNVSGKEIYAADIGGNDTERKVRHLSILNMTECANHDSVDTTHIRSLICFYKVNRFSLDVEALARNFRCLRVLDLSCKIGTNLSDSIGELLHLRYVDLSLNYSMEALPKSITKLNNLQTLILRHCNKLRELPKDLSRLVKLSFLDIKYCNEVSGMPRGMGKLTSLHTLKGGYRVGGEGRNTSWKQWLDGLEDLTTLINLKGKLDICMCWPKNAKNDVREDRREPLYLRSLEHLKHIRLCFCCKQDDEAIAKSVMENLQPHSNLKSLLMLSYHGVEMPSWATLLPCLVKLHLEDCKELKYLPCFGNLCHLKFLRLLDLPSLKYLEEDSSTTAQKVSFFPSLESLDFYMLPKLKGWRRGVGKKDTSNSSINEPIVQHCLSQLKKISIQDCPKLTCTLLCPILETLKLLHFSERLKIYCTKSDENSSEDGIENHENSVNNVVTKLREVTVTNGAWLNSMPMESFHGLQSLRVAADYEMEDLPSCLQHLSSLQTLDIHNCKNLKAMPKWMPKLTSLNKLLVHHCSKNLEKRCQKDQSGEDWMYIQHIPYINIDSP